MGLPKVEFTQCTPEQLEMAVDHERFDRVLQYRGLDLGDMDLDDFRDFALWIAKVMCGKMDMPVSAGKKAGRKRKK